ncbi:hypothetical protein MCAP1_001205 [Malassezia caprae]|uniref:Pet127-domain-containing protein n=1 Tax=Malassezia caprae TaxID=1381934 RepID=A0AAF0EAD1_9BASI|nr:hypothetical protein MCAP1_001205 [Malassezia caprae]
MRAKGVKKPVIHETSKSDKKLTPDTPKGDSESTKSPNTSKHEATPAQKSRASRPTTLLHGDEAKKARIVRIEQHEKEKDLRQTYGRLAASDVQVKPVRPLREMKVAKLSHGLDRVLFNPGIHWLKDQRTGIYNYDPHLRLVLDVDLFDYSALPPYLTSSRDQELLDITKKQEKRYCGSTSSMTGLLSHCYYLLSRWKEPELKGFSPSFQDMSTGFSEGAKLPASIMLRYQSGGFYAIDADKNSDGELDNTNYVLTSLGKSLEKFLTATPEEYALYERVNSWKLTEEERNQPEAYHYAETSKLLMRSQLDCQDPRLPNRTFDLKTRATVSIRNDRANYPEGSGYQIRFALGQWESFEREYWDMVRAAFLKYNFQVRIGHMDGIFVAYHNTAEIFGFQYISLEEMNLRLFGSNEMGDQAYHMSLGLLERILDAATDYMPEETLSITLETRSGANSMSFIVESTASAAVMQFDVHVDRYLNDAFVRGPVDFTACHKDTREATWEDIMQGRYAQQLRDIRWHVDYCITPRLDLSEEKIRANLQEIRARQRLMRTMCIPNVDMLNEREAHRIDVLSKKKGALQRFLRERENGNAIGMPLAPGQETTRQLIRRKGYLNLEKAGAKAPSTAIRWLRFPDATTKRIRELSQQGHERARKTIEQATPTVYQSL